MRFYFRTFTFEWCKRPSRQLKRAVINTAFLLLFIVCTVVALVMKYKYPEEANSNSNKGSDFILQLTYRPSPVSPMPRHTPTTVPSSEPPDSHSKNVSTTSKPSGFFITQISSKAPVELSQMTKTMSPSVARPINFQKQSGSVISKSQVSDLLSPQPSSKIYDELNFFVLGDIPYNRREQLVLVSQLQEIDDLITNHDDKSILIVHVGDLMSAYFSNCREERYSTISSILKSSATTVLTTPGDNEWNRCPDSNLAIANYTKYFIGIEEYWKGTNKVATMIERSNSRPENWSLFYSNILFLAMNMVYDDKSKPDIDAESRIQDNIKWFKKNCRKYCSDARAIIIFGHSIAHATTVFKPIHKRVFPLKVPLIYFTGNGHNYFVKRGLGEGSFPGDYFWRVQVDSGKKAPPIQVSIRSNNINFNDSDHFFQLDEHQEIFANLVKIDRRGGLYSEDS